MRRGLLKAVTACTAITVAVMTQAPSLASAAPADPGIQGLAKGRLIHTDGRPAAGATVTLYAVPNETAENAMVEGESRTFEVIGQFRADKQGRYAAAVTRSTLARFRDTGGNVNTELIARDAGGNIANMSIGLTPIEGSTGTAALARSRSEAALTPVAVSDLTLADPATSMAKNSTRGAQPDTVRKTGDPATRSGESGFEQAKEWVKPVAPSDAFVNGAGASEASVLPAIACGSVLVTNMGNRTTWIGGTYVLTTGVVADFVHTANASTTMGVGVSTKGAFGTFSASGTLAKSSTSETSYPAHSTRQHVYTGFVWGKYGYWCDNRPGYYQYKAMARYHGGGASTFVPSAAPSASYCASYVAGSSFAKTTSTAYTFGTGTDTSGSIGIDLSSRTGYTTTAKATFKFTSTRKLCGTNSLPGSSPGRLVAKA